MARLWLFILRGIRKNYPQTGYLGKETLWRDLWYYSRDLYQWPNALARYYDGKVLVYDWIRGWMMGR